MTLIKKTNIRTLRLDTAVKSIVLLCSRYIEEFGFRGITVRRIYTGNGDRGEQQTRKNDSDTLTDHILLHNPEDHVEAPKFGAAFSF